MISCDRIFSLREANGLAEVTQGEVVAIDGKALRRSFRHAGDKAFVHMVSAWATANRLVLGQIKTEEKSNGGLRTSYIGCLMWHFAKTTAASVRGMQRITSPSCGTSR